MNKLIECAVSLAAAVPPERRMPTPGLIVLFDGDRFVGAAPIPHWNDLFGDCPRVPYDGVVVIAYESPPALALLQSQCETHSIEYHGAIHDRPVTLGVIQAAYAS